jgi:hypothetical protein
MPRSIDASTKASQQMSFAYEAAETVEEAFQNSAADPASA